MVERKKTMSSKLRKWYVILGLTLGGLAVCCLLITAGGLAGGMAGYLAAHRGATIGLQGPWLQVQPQVPGGEEPPDVSPDQTQPWQMPPQIMLGAASGDLRGAVVVSVDSGGPAAAAGLKADDIIIAVDNKAMGADRDLAELITSHKPDDEVTLTIVRPGDDPELMNLKVTLDSATNEEGDQVAHFGVEYRPVSSGAGMMQLGRDLPSGEDNSQTY
jgi:membrane-associated protease RseP (regulator of RpoE activity)